MKTYIALLRGINVGGHRELKMADLRVLFEDLGFHEVVTYIQSGNVVFKTGNKNEFTEIISKEIEIRYGWEVLILVKKVSEIKKIVDKTPFSEDKKEKSYYTLLHETPVSELINSINPEDYPNEEFIITPGCVYFYSENGYGNAKCNNNFFERKLKVAATTRNYRTLAKLVELASKV